MMSTPPRSVLRVVLAAAASYVLLATPLYGQATQQEPTHQSQAGPLESAPKSDSGRQKAFKLYHAGNLVDALPLLEQVAADHPSDAAVKEALAFSVMGYSRTLTDTDLRKKARARARSIAVQAQQLGDRSSLLQMLLALPEDGSDLQFSTSKDVDKALKTGEADFARGDFAKAREGYLHALLLDPGNYEAALLVGDTHFRQHVYGSAGEWFAQAIQIDPNRETAYRYWGDTLLAMGNSSEARDKYINAILAEPYSQMSWGGLTQWAQRTKLTLNWLRLRDKGKFVSTVAGTKITLDPSFHTEDPMFKPWMAYYGRRSQWQQGKFKQQYPNEEQYRHTLSEEVDALRLMVLALKQPNVTNIDPQLATLVKIDQVGFIEPFALLNRADKDISQDYAPYRAIHRDALYRYFDEFVVPKAPTQ